MATNLDGRAMSSLGANNTDPTAFKTAFDSLKTSVDALQQPLAAMNDALATINKTLSDSAKKSNEFGKTVEEINSSTETWTKVVDAVNKVGKAFGAAGDIIGDAMGAVIPIVIAFGVEIVKWAIEMSKGETTVTALSKSLKESKMIMDTVSQANLKGIQNAQEQITHLQSLYQATQDQNMAMNGRIAAAKELQQLAPAFFGGLTTEAILAGKAAANYDLLRDSILAASKARASEQIITQNTVRRLGNDDKQQKLTEDLKKAEADVKAAKKAYGDNDKKYRNAVNDPNGAELSFAIDDAAKKVEEIKTSMAHLKTDSDILDRKNKALAQNILSNEEQQAADTEKATANQPKPPKPAKSATPATVPDNSKYENALKEAEDMHKASVSRQLQITMQEYGNELLQENANYNEQLKILQKLYQGKLIKQEEYERVSKQLLSEHHASVGSLIDKFNADDSAKAQEFKNQLKELEIKNAKDGVQKQKEELNQQQAERNQQYALMIADEVKKKTAIEDQLKQADAGTDFSKLKTALANKIELIELYGKKQKEEAEQTIQAIKKIDDQVAADAARKANTNLLKTDQKNIESAVKPDEKQAAEKQLILDKYKFEIDQAAQAGKETTALAEQRDEQIQAIDYKYAKEKADAAKKQAQELKDFELQAAQQVSNAAFSIVKNSISQQADAKVKQLETEKNSELSNTSLTSAQKQAIQQDYQKKEAAVKVKAFKDEQLASIGQALINGALAITKTTAQTGILAALAVPAVIAETAIQVATIAAQKPPAYARGGVHYHSDGRGGVLSGYSRTDNTNAYLRSGEGIVVSEAMRVPWARNLVSAINVGFGGRDFSMPTPTKGFAVGGIFTDGGDANRYYNQPVHDQKNLANTIAYQMINNFPPVYVDVKDINNQQNILAQTINRVNL